MSEKFERIQLNDEQVEHVAGGVIMYKATTAGCYLYSIFDKETKFSFQFKDIDAIDAVCLQFSNEGKSDAETIEYLMSQGLCQPM